jgi:hypothetical protein
MESPDIYVLAQLRWQFFGTLTFKKERMPERVRLGMYFAMLRQLASKHGVYFPRLPWCLRQESGEQFGRRHFHFLLTGLPRNVVTISSCFVIMHQWEQHGGGMARVHVFDHALNGVGYITKCLGQTPDAGDVYESAKFGSRNCELMLSHGARAILRSRVNATERRLAQ